MLTVIMQMLFAVMIVTALVTCRISRENDQFTVSASILFGYFVVTIRGLGKVDIKLHLGFPKGADKE